MKKVVFVLAAAGLMSLAACSKQTPAENDTDATANALVGQSFPLVPTQIANVLSGNVLAGRENLGAALAGALEDLDGFFTFVVGTKSGFGVLRDPIACKPAIIAETDDWVAMASEYRALAGLPGIDAARIFEPAPGVVYTWHVPAAVGAPEPVPA